MYYTKWLPKSEIFSYVCIVAKITESTDGIFNTISLKDNLSILTLKISHIYQCQWQLIRFGADEGLALDRQKHLFKAMVTQLNVAYIHHQAVNIKSKFSAHSVRDIKSLN